MASRRDLKKHIKNVSSELISELYFYCLTVKNLDEEKVDQLTIDILEMNSDLTARVSHLPKNDKSEVKKYFGKLHQDWKAALEGIVSAMAELSGSKAD